MVPVSRTPLTAGNRRKEGQKERQKEKEGVRPMPDKSVREMSLWERRRHSLAARTFYAVVAMAVILGLAAVLIGVGMYYRTVSGQYIRNAYSVSAEASAILR